MCTKEYLNDLSEVVVLRECRIIYCNDRQQLNLQLWNSQV